MINKVRVRLTPEQSSDEKIVRLVASRQAKVSPDDIRELRVVRSSLDARHRSVFVDQEILLGVGENLPLSYQKTVYQDVQGKQQVIVVGSGPAGLFASLRLLELGYKPVILERGGDVHQRKLDIAQMQQNGKVNPDSNYSFGEGGAGAFSDGKLFTRSDKRGDVSKVLSQFCQHGASEQILYDAHPHIGSDKLPSVIEQIRTTILNHGGEVHFHAKVTSLVIKEGRVIAVRTDNGEQFDGPVILAAGHSARDLYQYFEDNHLALESKALAVGVRLEHPQDLIDKIQYHNPAGRGRFLPPADYFFVDQVRKRGVYSFCMCPGGVVIPASTQEGLLVVNGMSSSTRSGRWANSGMVVELHPEDLPQDRFKGNLGMLNFLEALESRCAKAGGGSLVAPAQRMDDFVKGKVSSSLPQSSYYNGLASVDMHSVLPQFISRRLAEGFVEFDKRAHGFLTNDAVLIAPETRTSSPVRIPRMDSSLMHVQLEGLFPCGEGAGYAGGIVSAALDGINCADALKRYATVR
ncbi:MAG: NAD(P)/FAD-dependent oxidoreductase [Sphaerochaetaceae bacterium]